MGARLEGGRGGRVPTPPSTILELKTLRILPTPQPLPHHNPSPTPKQQMVVHGPDVDVPWVVAVVSVSIENVCDVIKEFA